MNSTSEIYLSGNYENVPIGQFRIQRIRALDAAELRDFHVVLNEVVEFASHFALFSILEKNYAEFLAGYESFQERFRTSREMNPAINNSILNEINRLLINYLSSLRTVLDHYATRYTRLDRAGSGHLAIFEAATNISYDSSFAYRFMYKLRNYVQHCGLPIEGVGAELAPTTDGGGTGHLEVYIERDALLTKFSDWRQVRPELEAQPEHIEISGLIKANHDEVRKIIRVIARIEIGVIDVAREYLAGMAEEVEAQCPGTTPVVADFSQVRNGDGEVQTLRVPVSELARILQIRVTLDSDPNCSFGA